jgi:hypothetical protein
MNPTLLLVLYAIGVPTFIWAVCYGLPTLISKL